MTKLDLTSKEGREQFLQMLKSQSIKDELVERVIEKPQAFSDTTTDQILWAVTHNKPVIRKFAKAVLSVSKDPERANVIADKYRKAEDKQKKGFFLSALAACDSKPVLNLIGKMLNNKAAAKRIEALDLFLQIDDWHKHRQVVTLFLEDPVAKIQHKTIEAIASTAPKAYASYLRDQAAGEDQALRDMCLRALVKLEDPKNIAVFLERLPLEERELKESLFQAALILVKGKPEETRPYLLPCLGSTDPDVRKTAVYFAIQFPDQSDAIRDFLLACCSLSAEIREEIYAEAANHKDEFTEFVRYILSMEKEPTIRMEALTLAKQLKHEKLNEFFMNELESSDWLARRTAIEYFGELGHEPALAGNSKSSRRFRSNYYRHSSA